LALDSLSKPATGSGLVLNKRKQFGYSQSLSSGRTISNLYLCYIIDSKRLKYTTQQQTRNNKEISGPWPTSVIRSHYWGEQKTRRSVLRS